MVQITDIQVQVQLLCTISLVDKTKNFKTYIWKMHTLYTAWPHEFSPLHALALHLLHVLSRIRPELHPA